MMERDATKLCGPHYGHRDGKPGHRWGKTGFHGGKVAPGRSRVRGRGGREMPLPSWEVAQSEDLLGSWALNLMLVNVSTRRFARTVRLPEGDIPAVTGDGVSKVAVSRRFMALSAARMETWTRADLSKPNLLMIRIDRIHTEREPVLRGAIGVDAEGDKHPLGVMEGASGNAAMVQAKLDNLVDRGLDPKVRRLFIVDGANTLRKAIRRTFGERTPIQRRQIHKGRNIMERLPKHLCASVRGHRAWPGNRMTWRRRNN